MMGAGGAMRGAVARHRDTRPVPRLPLEHLRAQGPARVIGAALFPHCGKPWRLSARSFHRTLIFRFNGRPWRGHPHGRRREPCASPRSPR
ncbi:hypothetical protein Xaut_2713 [Xanthobacter versatilis]|uniref:Uncharacterized protein n=1 Tax=Xanthobacter autotrophicus (strain ATCC BAA-1158 / Py2) TaxID=78245 RepID=A7IIW0_XANP2|nr:hypothetical protein Xaut_2713 [Xanthobacter autotrophicus Py2]